MGMHAPVLRYRNHWRRSRDGGQATPKYGAGDTDVDAPEFLLVIVRMPWYSSVFALSLESDSAYR